MSFLLDTNILLRWQRPEDPLGLMAAQAVEILMSTEQELYVTPQNFIEFWSVFTRPIEVNGMGHTVNEAREEIDSLQKLFRLTAESEQIYTNWKSLVTTHHVIGVKVYDARLVAIMQVYGIPHLLTFNTADFTRFSEITALHPQEIVSAKKGQF